MRARSTWTRLTGSRFPPALLQFSAEQAGFSDPRIARVNTDSLGAPLAYAPHEAPHALYVNSVIGLLNLHHYVAPDYAIVAQKDGGLASIANSEELDRLCGTPPDLEEVRRLEAESVAREAEAKAKEAEAKAREAEAKEREAEAKEREAEAGKLQAWAEARAAQTRAEDAEARVAGSGRATAGGPREHLVASHPSTEMDETNKRPSHRLAQVACEASGTGTTPLAAVKLGSGGSSYGDLPGTLLSTPA